MSIRIRPLDVLLWTFRRNAGDIVRLYDTLSPVMQLASGGDMLNFGYWAPGSNKCPIDAQKALSSLAASLGEFGSSKNILDVGSGLCAPALYWKSQYEKARICCLNINFNQLSYSSKIQEERNATGTLSSAAFSDGKERFVQESLSDLSYVNATSTDLPFANKSVNTLVALESAQHFRPFADFIRESKRVLVPGGLLIVAMPVMLRDFNPLGSLFKLGSLSLTWSSEHFQLDFVKTTLLDNGFQIKNLASIGHCVYEPLADYYIANRNSLKQKILKRYSPFVESMLYRSMLRMKKLSEKNVIDYVIIKAM